MIKLNKIYFDGKGYLKTCIDLEEQLSPDLVKICSRLNFTPVDSITFNDNENFCSITIGDYYLQEIPVDCLYTDISNVDYSPTPNPGGLYWFMQKKLNEDWRGVIIDYLFIKGEKIENIFAHAVKRKHRNDGHEYYEIMVPTYNFCTYFVDSDKIERFLWKLIF